MIFLGGIRMTKLAWNEVKCSHCKAGIQFDATVCRHCLTNVTPNELAKRKTDHKNGKLGCGIFAILAVLTLTYCSSNADQTENEKSETIASQATPKLDATVEPLTVPQPHYSSIDGDDYLYVAGISSDEQKAGQVAENYVSFRYKGTKDGKITIASQGMTLRCDVDCRVITISSPYGTKEHVGYTPNSVAGAAFTDAMNGLLVERPSQDASRKSKK
jgi:ribosomal protein L40E